jgi:hypothetical protein
VLGRGHGCKALNRSGQTLSISFNHQMVDQVGPMPLPDSFQRCRVRFVSQRFNNKRFFGSQTPS